jgi:hypothetical protein
MEEESGNPLPCIDFISQHLYCTGLTLEECHESLNAIQQNIGEACFQSVNHQLYHLILSHRQAGHTPRRAAFRAVQEFYC